MRNATPGRRGRSTIAGAKATAVAVGSLVLLVVAVGCSPDAADAPEAAEGPDELRSVEIGQSGLGTPFAPVYLAQSEGLFAEEGVEVGDLPTLGGDVSAALLAGDIDFALEGADSVVAQHAEGIEAAIAVDKFVDPTARQIIVSNERLAEAGVSAEDPLAQRLAALEGATVGVLTAVGVQRIALHLIAEHGELEAALDVIELPAGPSAMLGALEQGRIDAFMWNPPFGPLAERQGIGEPVALVPELPGYDFPELVLTTRREVIEDDPELVAAVTRAVHRGKTFMADHPEDAIDALAPVFETDREIMEATFELLLPAVPIGEGFDAAQWERLLDLMAETGQLDAELDPTEGELWTNEFIDQTER